MLKSIELSYRPPKPTGERVGCPQNVVNRPGSAVQPFPIRAAELITLEDRSVRADPVRDEACRSVRRRELGCVSSLPGDWSRPGGCLSPGDLACPARPGTSERSAQGSQSGSSPPG